MPGSYLCTKRTNSKETYLSLSLYFRFNWPETQIPQQVKKSIQDFWNERKRKFVRETRQYSGIMPEF
jgi:hypothetical protein